MADDDQLLDLIKTSRSFMHDISNQLLIAHGMESFVHMKIQKGAELDEALIGKMEKSIMALDKIMDMMKEHKEYIMKVQEIVENR